MVKNSLKKGFTLIEVLLVIAIIAILAAIVIIAINPARQIAQSNNAQRRSNVNAIVNAISQYQVDNRGTVPATITTVATDICQTGVTSTACIDLSVLTTNQTYIGSLPTDPTSSTSPSTGYQVSKNANGRVTVTAPYAENSETISVTR